MRLACSTLLALVVVALCAACGGGGSASGDVEFLVFGDPPELQAYRQLIRAFEQDEPDIHVRMIEASDREDLIARLSTSFAGGRPPDLFLINYRFYGQFAAKGVLEPLGARADDSNEVDTDGFYPQALKAFEWKGEQTCLPQNISSLVVYYNRDLFKRFQVPEPKSNWTWPDFVRTATALTRDAQGNAIQGADPDQPGVTGPTVRPAIYGVGVEPAPIRVAPFVWSNGGEVVDDDEHPTRLAFDSPEAQAALVEFFGLRQAYGVTPTDVEVEAEDDETRFTNGRLGMLLESRRLTPALRAAAKFDWDVAPLPRFRKPATILHSDAYCMSKASDNKDAAWRFVEFALGEDGQRLVARTGRTVPSLKVVAESRDFLDPNQKPRRSRVFLDAIPTIRHVPTISTWPEIEDAAEGILENAMYLGTPVDKVVRQLEQTTRPMFARAER